MYISKKRKVIKLWENWPLTLELLYFKKKGHAYLNKPVGKSCRFVLSMFEL